MKHKEWYKRYPISVQESAVEQMRLGVNVSQLAEQLGVSRGTLYQWKGRAERRDTTALVGSPAADPLEQRDYRIRELESRVAGLEGELGRAELEKRFFESALRRIEESRQKKENSGGTTSTPRSATR